MGIGTLNENPLHAALKQWYADPDDRLEAPLHGYVIDIVRQDLLIEIQTGGFSPIARKLLTLLSTHRVRLVHPIAQNKWILKLSEDDETISRRKSPKRGRIHDIFAPLTAIPHLLLHPRFELEVLLIDVEEIQRFDGKRGWRRKGWIVHERRLLAVNEEHRIDTPEASAQLLPPDLPVPFTTADLASHLQIHRRLAQQMAYCLRKMERIEIAGKSGNALCYTPSNK
ncbi:MAG: hypothetical protein R2873_10725 [Caldilineaceae bacterium]